MSNEMLERNLPPYLVYNQAQYLRNKYLWGKDV